VILVTGEEHRYNGNKFYKQGNYKAALECYTAAIDTEPNVGSFYNNRSAVNLMLCHYIDAYNDSKKSCELDPSNLKALLRLGKCQTLLGLWTESESMFEKILTQDPTNVEAKTNLEKISTCKSSYEQYRAQKDKQDYRHALFCIDRCLETSAGSDDLKLAKIELLICLKRYPEAKCSLESLIDKTADSHVNTEALYYRGLCLYYMEHLDKAQSHFQHVLKQSPDHVGAQQAYRRCKKLSQLKEEGNTLVRCCQYEKARIAYTSALEIDQNHDEVNAKLYFNRSLTLTKLERWEDALNDCNKALELDQHYIKAMARRVSCLIGLSRFEEAEKEAERLNKKYPSDENAKLYKQSKVALKRSKQLNPYTILGVPQNASDAEIKKGYRKRALLHHPDRHSHADEATRHAEEQKFKEVNTAYSVLSDPRKKQMYDSGVDIDEVLGNCGGGGGGSSGFHGGDPMEVFQAFFSGGNGGGFKMNFHHQ